MSKTSAKRLAKKAREKELFLLFKEFMKEVEEIEFFIFQKIKNSKEFKNYISKLEDRKLPNLFSVCKKSFDIAYVYAVEALCNDYLSERYRIGAFTSFDEALDFVAKNFYKSEKSKISYSRESNDTWVIDNSEIKNQSIRHRVTDNYIENVNIDAREIRIRVDTSNFILLNDGRLIQIRESFFHDEIICLD